MVDGIWLDALRDKDLDAIAVSRRERIIVLNNGARVPFGIMFNGQDETNDAHAATAVIGQMVDGRWIVIDMSFFEEELVH